MLNDLLQEIGLHIMDRELLTSLYKVIFMYIVRAQNSKGRKLKMVDYEKPGK